MTARQVARILSISEKTVYSYVSRNLIPHYKIEANVRFRARDLAIAEDPTALDHVEWRDLERIIASALRELGFWVELTPPAKDGGKDIIARCTVGKAQKTYYVEVKHWKKDKPGSGQITAFIQVNSVNQTDGGLFLSSSGYSEWAHSRIGEIMRQRVRLGERDKIVALCQQYVRTKRASGYLINRCRNCSSRRRLRKRTPLSSFEYPARPLFDATACETDLSTANAPAVCEDRRT